jgi:hypothetical protein
MTEVQIPIGHGQALCFDTDDVEQVSTPVDVIPDPQPDTEWASNKLGKHHLNITFRDGKAALWKVIDKKGSI